MNLVVFDVGGTTVKFARWLDGQLNSKGFFLTPQTWLEMKQKIKEVVQNFKESSPKSLDGIAISCPGSVDTEFGVIKGDSAIPYIHFFPIREELERELGLPVTLENDAYCAALAELSLGEARDVENAVFLVIGTGIGGAVIINRELIKGNNLFGGEFGYMLLDDEHSLSDLGSPVNTAKRYSLEEKLNPPITGSELFLRAEQGDDIALKHVNQMKDSLARGIQLLLVSLNPDKVIIGGGISARGDLIDDLKERVERLLIKTSATDVEVNLSACRFQNDANLIGAVSFFESQYKEKNYIL